MKNNPITKKQVENLPKGLTITSPFDNRKTRRSRPAKEMNNRGNYSLLILKDESGRQRKIKRSIQFIPLFGEKELNPMNKEDIRPIIGYKRVVHWI